MIFKKIRNLATRSIDVFLRLILYKPWWYGVSSWPVFIQVYMAQPQTPDVGWRDFVWYKSLHDKETSNLSRLERKQQLETDISRAERSLDEKDGDALCLEFHCCTGKMN